MILENFLKTFKEHNNDDAIIWKDEVYSYQWLLDRIDHWKAVIDENNIAPGSVVVLNADFSPNSVALFLSLMDACCVLVPLANLSPAQKDKFIEVARGEIIFDIKVDDEVAITVLQKKADHPIYDELRARQHPGLVLFSSGSTGESKAAVHDLVNILEKFKTQRHCYRAISFLLYDHIGGVNTMLYTLSNAGCLVTVQDRQPESVLKTIEQHRVDLLPASPTFINLILFSEAYKQYKLDTLKIVTYGTEPMPESTLKRFTEIYPDVKMVQTYGLSEVGILRSKSKSSDSLWVKVGGEGFETRIVDGTLHIKAQSAMLGYLNAPSPFTEDGWLDTGDSVETDGEYIRILGRKSEIINVGGEKVYPVEVENVIQKMDNVAEVTVYGEKNPIMGNIVCAKVRLKSPEEKKDFSRRLKKHCRECLQAFKVPVRITIEDEALFSNRFKKVRNLEKKV